MATNPKRERRPAELYREPAPVGDFGYWEENGKVSRWHCRRNCRPDCEQQRDFVRLRRMHTAYGRRRRRP